MIAPDLLRLLCCPENHQPLRLAEAELVANLNRRIAAGQVSNRAGQVLKDPLEGGLVREDGQWMYPIQLGLPVLLVDEGISLT
jgi:uncharacterized protein YbaR (Trm112 family)